MLIRSTPQACFVILSNGLTLELFFDITLTGDERATAGSTVTPAATRGRAPLRGSQGVWLMGESVLFEVSAGQA